MKINSEICIVGKKVVLVPYCSYHVEKYHQWMKSEELLNLTGSEPLTLEEEYRMQRSWYEDEDKCTFIVLDREVLEKTKNEQDAMVGDTNIFLTDPSDSSIAEAEIMIAEQKNRGHGLGKEALLLMLKYAVSALHIKTLEAKIKYGNTPSLHLFTNLKFCEVKRSDVFEEITLAVKVTEEWLEFFSQCVPQYVVQRYQRRE
ncbi:microtubule-associated Nat9 [Oratosquilla oratoria]|uniref:microtubule-associated Nat9 n=1 Tax=Oratosquilla oratoria TaxID=337810 RepID=UPI003F75C4BD